MAGNESTISLKLKIDESGTIQLDKFSGKLKETTDQATRMGSALSSLKTSSIVYLAEQAFHAGERFYDMARSIASGAMEIGKMSQISGLSTDAFQKFAYAAKMSDVESESLAVGIKRLAKNMEESSQGSGDAAKWFSVMGISVKDLNTGGLKPLDQMMGELADKFSGWEDGTRKIAIATALFGRSGEALIPMLNKGKSGLTEFYTEAERLGIVLSPDIVRKGQEAEDAFKRFEAQLKTFKLSLSPVVSELTNYLSVITDIINKGKELIFAVVPKGPAYELTGEQKKLFSLWGFGATQGEKIKRKPELWETFGGESILEKGKAGLPPELPKEYPITKMADDLWKSFKQGEGVIKIIQGDVVEMIPVIKDYEGWWEKINTDLDELKLKMKMVTPEGVRWGAEELIGLKSGEMMIDGTIYDIKFWEKITKEIEDLQLEFKKTIIPGTTGWEGAEPLGLNPGEMKIGGRVLKIDEYVKQMEEQGRMIESIGAGIANIWTSHLDAMFKGTESFSKGIKNIFSDMGSYVISIFEKMAVNWLLFGDIGGKYTKGSGLGLIGILGKATGLFQEGGSFWTHGPTPIMAGEGGESEFVSITPKSKMRGGGQNITQHYYIISAVDPESFDRILRRNSGSVKKIVMNDLKTAGGLARG